MNKKWLTIIVVVILVIIGIVLLGGGDVEAPEDNETTDVVDEVSTSTDDDTTVDEDEASVAEVTVGASNFSFDTEEIVVNEGDTVRITLVNNEGFHDFVLDGFNVRTAQIQAGQQETIEFVADEAGTYEYYCSVGNHRAMGMVGTLIVE